MRKNQKIHRNRWYEISLADGSTKIVKGQQSIPAARKKYKNQIRSIRRISLERWNQYQESMYGKYLAFLDLEYNTGEEPGIPTEIISVGIVVADRKNLKKKETYYSLVHPRINTTLNPYCMELTGLKQKEIDHARSFAEVFAEVEEFYRKWGIRQTYVYGNADSPVLRNNAELNEIPDKVTYLTDCIKDIAEELFLSLFDREGSISLEKLGRVLDIRLDGEWHNALYDAELLWRCHSAVIHKEIPENLLTQAKNELALKEIYMQNRRFDEVKSGFPEEKKAVTEEIIQELRKAAAPKSMKETAKLLALCDDILVLTGERPRYQKEYTELI
ncbi:MAG: exonuclease domain-containing protein [Sellimonas sp.]|uniref:exonuclease domain-containing protein n=1 Tax=Sellimonas sp. TaxID=2021466 RepID=UPI00399FEB69